MANIYNKRLAFGNAPEPGLLGGVLPFAPVNRMSMLTDYIDPAERAVACPNLYNRHHFFEPNVIKRYSVGTKNKDLKKAADGSLKVYVQADEPKDPAARANRLPSPTNGEFSLYVRAYWPDDAITRGQWTPQAVVKVARPPASRYRWRS